MRLICGLWQLDGQPAAHEVLAAMANALVVPGLQPDIRIWREGPVGMAVIDFSRDGTDGALPRSRDGRVTAADVRLDEPAALAQELGAATSSEDQLLHAAVATWGAQAPLHMLGDYAFADWEPACQRLLCGRDALGIRPLVYTYSSGNLFAFASMPRALHTAGLVSWQLNQAAFVRRVFLHWDGEDTLAAGIRRLPAGHVLEVSAKGLKRCRYWALSRDPARARRIGPAEAAHELRRLLDEAVRCRVAGAGPVAVHLSGGLDSSSIAILAARHLHTQGRTLLAYSFIPRQGGPEPLEDETPYVDAVRAQEPEMVWTPIFAPEFSCWLNARLDIDGIISTEPDDPENAICAHAAGRGAEIVLSGWGGDEGATFNARGTLAEAFIHGRWRYLAREMAALKRTRRWSRRQIWHSEVFSYLVPEAIANLYRRLVGRPPQMWDLGGSWLAPEMIKSLCQSAGNQPVIGPNAWANRWQLLSSPHIAERTETWANIGVRHGQAFAFPMLDRRVVEFALSLPSAFFLRDGFKRRVIRDAMAGVLPDSIRWRHQKFMPLPDILAAAVAHRDVILARLDEALEHSEVRAIFDINRLRADAAAFLSAPDAADTGRGRVARVCLVLNAICYLEQHPW